MSRVERVLRGLLTARGRRAQLVGVTAANLLPVGGVVVLGWNVVTLLTLYWLELAVAGAFAFGRSVFQPPQNVDREVLLVGPLAAREVTVPVPLTGLQIHLATVLLTPILVCVFGFVWVMTAGFIFAPIGTPGDTALTNATLGAFCTAGTTAVGTVVDTPTDRDPRTAMITVLFKTGSVFLVGVATVVLVGAATGGAETTVSEVDAGLVAAPLLVAVVSIKYVADLGVLYRDRLRAFVDRFGAAAGHDGYENGHAAYDSSEDGGHAAAPGGNSTDPDGVAGNQFGRRVRPTRRARLLGGVVRAASHQSVFTIGFLGVAVGGLLAVAGAWPLATAVLSGATAVVTVLVGADILVRRGGVEYRVGDGRVVAYDTLFDSRLWCVEAWDERALRVERGRLDRLLGTETVVIVLPETEHRLAGLAVTDAVVTAFDREAERPEE
jgi:hypothetical protein